MFPSANVFQIRVSKDKIRITLIYIKKVVITDQHVTEPDFQDQEFVDFPSFESQQLFVS